MEPAAQDLCHQRTGQVTSSVAQAKLDAHLGAASAEPISSTEDP